MLISYFYFLSVLRSRSSSHLLSCPRPFPLSLLMCALIGCFEPRIPINWTFQVAWRRFSWCASTYPRARPPCRGVKRGSNSVYWRETTNFRGYWDHETNTFNPGEFNRVVFLQTKPEIVERWGEFVFLKIICLFCKIISTEKEIKCQQTRLKW